MTIVKQDMPKGPLAKGYRILVVFKKAILFPRRSLREVRATRPITENSMGAPQPAVRSFFQDSYNGTLLAWKKSCG